jgi:membrane-bound metal-dependent hydrolase YbcI (DUF457 family)
MPSPIGHALAGIAATWMADLLPGRRAWRTAPRRSPWLERAGNGFTLVGAALAASPDLDLLLFKSHRMATHSLGAVVVVAVLAAALAARAGRPVSRVALMCAAAYSSHLLLDWMCADNYPPRGVQLLWPVTSNWYISSWEVFRQTARNDLLSSASIRTNLLAIAQELAILLPLLAGVWLVRVKALAGLAAEVAGGDHAPQ